MTDLPAELTEHQQYVLDAIVEYLITHNTMPTLSNIMTHLGYSCRGSVQHHVKALRRAGYLSDQPGGLRLSAYFEVTVRRRANCPR